MDALTPKSLGIRSTLLVDKHAAFIKKYNRMWEVTDRLEYVATEHFWMSGIYWGLSAMALMGRLDEMDGEGVVQWVIRCWRPDPAECASTSAPLATTTTPSQGLANLDLAAPPSPVCGGEATERRRCGCSPSEDASSAPGGRQDGSPCGTSDTCVGGVRGSVTPRRYGGGGFGASERNDPHLLATCSAVQVLALYDKLDAVDVDKVANYVASLQNADGSFCGDIWGEVDTRFTYCAFLVLSILGRLDAVDVDLACQFIARCRNFDGGFGCTPGNESHAGQVFTCVGALCLAGRMDLVDPDLLGWWLAERQTKSGGLNGRPEKLQDVCYSWWCLSSLSAMGRLHWIDGEELSRFILHCQDEEDGGISDRPEDMADVYHSFFGIAGLALLGYGGLRAVDPLWALPVEVVERIQIRNAERAKSVMRDENKTNENV